MLSPPAFDGSGNETHPFEKPCDHVRPTVEAIVTTIAKMGDEWDLMTLLSQHYASLPSMVYYSGVATTNGTTI